MKKVLIIGAGGVGAVVAHKCAQVPEVFGGIMLAMGRAAEDTAVIMLTGVVVNSGLPAGLGSKFEALPFLIFYTAAQYVDQNELLRGFGAALVLLVLSAGLLYAASKLQRTMEKRWKGAR